MMPQPGPLAGIRAVTFDVTGTLIHSPHRGEIYAEVLTRHGRAVEPRELERLIGEVWRELAIAAPAGRDRFNAHPGGARGFWARLLDRILEHLGQGPATPFAAAELYARFARADAWEVYAGVFPALSHLADSGLRLAVIANWDERLPALLADLGLAERFETIVYSQEVGCEKPDPRIFRIALDRLELLAEEVLHIGDRRREDYEGAISVGMEARILSRSGRGDLSDLREVPGLLGL